MRLFNIHLPLKLGASGGCSMSLIDLQLADKFVGGQASDPIIEPLTVSENGTYTAPMGVDGYSPVTVEVRGSGEELVITDFSYFCYKDARLSLLDKIDTSKGTDFSGMFSYSTKIAWITILRILIRLTARNSSRCLLFPQHTTVSRPCSTPQKA